MGARIGLIQTRDIGDIIIALPIADFFLERGDAVFWPIDEQFVSFFRDARPEIHFIPVRTNPVSDEDHKRYFLDDPMRALRAANCDRIIPLYAYLEFAPVADAALARSLKFDEYKYAVAGVPFARKWDLRLRRNPGREAALHQRLGIRGPYICTHTRSGQFVLNIAPPPEWMRACQVIEITHLTDNPFDWLYTLEHAKRLILLDSCFSNLVEQLNFPVEKSFIMRSEVRWTPVLRNAWERLGLPRQQ